MRALSVRMRPSLRPPPDAEASGVRAILSCRKLRFHANADSIDSAFESLSCAIPISTGGAMFLPG
jgi:hypothetical protein